MPATPTAADGAKSGSSGRTYPAIASTSSPKSSVSRTEPTSRLTARSRVISSVDPPPTSSTSVPFGDFADALERQRRLLLAAEQPRREAVAPLDLAEERLAVLGVADGARRDREHALGAERLGLAAVVGEHVAHARDRQRQQAAPRVHALAETRDLLPQRHLVHAPVVDVRDEEPRRSSSRGRPQRRASLPRVHRGSHANESSESCSAVRRTASRATERWSRSTLASSLGAADSADSIFCDRRSTDCSRSRTGPSIVALTLFRSRKKRRACRNT